MPTATTSPASAYRPSKSPSALTPVGTCVHADWRRASCPACSARSSPSPRPKSNGAKPAIRACRLKSATGTEPITFSGSATPREYWSSNVTYCRKMPRELSQKQRRPGSTRRKNNRLCDTGIFQQSENRNRLSGNRASLEPTFIRADDENSCGRRSYHCTDRPGREEIFPRVFKSMRVRAASPGFSNARSCSSENSPIEPNTPDTATTVVTLHHLDSRCRCGDVGVRE